MSVGLDVKTTVKNFYEDELIPPPPKDPHNELWNKTFGHGGGKFVQQTLDDGYIIISSIKPPGSYLDIKLIKTNIDGIELWNKTYGGPYEDVGHQVRVTSDGGFILTGYYSHAQGGPYDIVLIKTDENGNMTWEKRFNYGPKNTTFGESVIELDDGYLVMSDIHYPGIPSTTDIWLIKTDFDGNEIWNKTVGETNGRDFCEELIQTSEGDFLIVGHTSHSYVLLIKTDKDGNRLWRKTIADEYGGFRGKDIIETTDGGYAIAANYHLCLIKTSKGGHVQWKKNYDYYWAFGLRSVIQTIDDGYILIGAIPDKYLGGDLIVIKADKYGNREWEKIWYGEGSDGGANIIQSNDGTYVIAGTTNSFGEGGAWLIKMEPFENHRPSNPVINGPINGIPLTEIIYSATSIEGEGEQLYFVWYYSDGCWSGWLGPYNSAEICYESYYWLGWGPQSIRVKSRDIYGGDSEWVTYYVNLPRTKITLDSFWLSFIDRFPILQKLLLLTK